MLLSSSAHTHSHTHHFNTVCHIVHYTLLLFFFSFFHFGRRLVLHPFFPSSEREDKRDTERRERKGGGEAVTLSSPDIQRRDRERDVHKKEKRERDGSVLFYFTVCCGPLG